MLLDIQSLVKFLTDNQGSHLLKHRGKLKLEDLAHIIYMMAGFGGVNKTLKSRDLQEELGSRHICRSRLV